MTSDKSPAKLQPLPGGYDKAPLDRPELKVAAVQMYTEPVDPDSPAQVMEKNLGNFLSLCDEAGRQGCRLIVFPEFALAAGRPGSIAGDWDRRQSLDLSIPIPGPQTKAIGTKAKELGCFICFSSYFKLADWPGHFINGSIISGPSGEVIYIHWKVYWGYPGIGMEHATSISDVLDEWVRRYGWDAVWPVARTPVGNIAGYVCSEGFYPEVARAYGFNGAEIICRNISGGGRGNWDERVVTQFRGDCASNLVWGVYANNASAAAEVSEKSFRGASMIVAPSGRIMAEAKGTTQEIVTATIPIAELRTEQNRYDKFHNPHLTPSTYRGGVRTELMVKLYEQHPGQFPPNLLTQYQKEHGGALPPDLRAARNWYLEHARWTVAYHDPAE